MKTFIPMGWSLGAPRTKITDHVVNIYCKQCVESWNALNEVLHNDTADHSQY